MFWSFLSALSVLHELFAYLRLKQQIVMWCFLASVEYVPSMMGKFCSQLDCITYAIDIYDGVRSVVSSNELLVVKDIKLV